MLEKNQYPQFFIRKKDEAKVRKEIGSVMNMEFAKAVSSQGFEVVKNALSRIVNEAISNPSNGGLSVLPETIEILFYGAKKQPDLLDSLLSLSSGSSKVVEHSINVLSIATQYCFFKGFPDDKVKNICLCALLHDIGTSGIDKTIIETDKKITEKEYLKYKKHTVLGFKQLQQYPSFDRSVEVTALEHHELLDGSGYPKGTTQISFEAMVIGLIDTYESLKYRARKYRNPLSPYAALQIIKKDVIKGKYNKDIFVDLCSCLIK